MRDGARGLRDRAWGPTMRNIVREAAEAMFESLEERTGMKKSKS